MEEKKKFECHLCKKTYKTEKPLKNHMVNLTCIICKMHFSQKSILEDHIAEHTGEKLFECKQCMEYFSTNKQLLNHNKLNHAVSHFKCDTTKYYKFKCHICRKPLTKIDNLLNHMILHSDEFKMGCIKCERIFTNQDAMKLHLTQFHKFAISECDLCKKKYYYKSTLKDHMLKAHTDEKPFKCPECPKLFVLNKYLLAHMECHLDQKYNCSVCKKSYKYKRGMNRHESTHA